MKPKKKKKSYCTRRAHIFWMRMRHIGGCAACVSVCMCMCLRCIMLWTYDVVEKPVISSRNTLCGEAFLAKCLRQALACRCASHPSRLALRPPCISHRPTILESKKKSKRSKLEANTHTANTKDGAQHLRRICFVFFFFVRFAIHPSNRQIPFSFRYVARTKMCNLIGSCGDRHFRF